MNLIFDYSVFVTLDVINSAIKFTNEFLIIFMNDARFIQPCAYLCLGYLNCRTIKLNYENILSMDEIILASKLLKIDMLFFFIYNK